MEWIKVEDRLPSEDMFCIVFVQMNDYRNVHAGLYSKDNGFLDDFYNIEVGVTHWMPLPEPPKD